MQDVDLFLSLAEIAGVFVGFGALIAVRSGGPSDSYEVAYIRAVVWIGIWVVIAALAPVIVSRYEITGHVLWPACSLLALALFLSLFLVYRHTIELWVVVAAKPRATLVGEMNRPDFDGDSTAWRIMESWQNTAAARSSGDTRPSSGNEPSGWSSRPAASGVSASAR